MFICLKCATPEDCDFRKGRSFGPCEVCGYRDECYDVDIHHPAYGNKLKEREKMMVSREGMGKEPEKEGLNFTNKAAVVRDLRRSLRKIAVDISAAREVLTTVCAEEVGESIPQWLTNTSVQLRNAINEMRILLTDLEDRAYDAGEES